MAKKVNITLVDDIDGSAAEETIHFAYKGTNYKIDLSRANASILDGHLSPFIAKAERVSRVKAVGVSRKASKEDRDRYREIRQWAHKNGHPVSSRGRIPETVEKAFNEAQTRPRRARRTQETTPEE